MYVFLCQQIGLPPEMRSVGDEDVFHTLNKDGKDRRDEKGVIVVCPF